MMAPGLREVGASGQAYLRDEVLEVLDARTRSRRPPPADERLDVDEFACERLAPDVRLATCRLDQGGRISRRATR